MNRTTSKLSIVLGFCDKVLQWRFCEGIAKNSAEIDRPHRTLVSSYLHIQGSRKRFLSLEYSAEDMLIIETCHVPISYIVSTCDLISGVSI